jgi:hypothetical protein
VSIEELAQARLGRRRWHRGLNELAWQRRQGSTRVGQCFLTSQMVPGARFDHGIDAHRANPMLAVAPVVTAGTSWTVVPGAMK